MSQKEKKVTHLPFSNAHT